MIVKQYHDVIEGNKRQTRRLKDRYEVGRVYSVVPKMYKPTVWYRFINGKADVWHEHYSESQPQPMEFDRVNWTPLKVQITAKHREHLQSISRPDAIAEGIQMIHGDNGAVYTHHLTEMAWRSPIEAYQNLWEGINKKPGTRWQDNPVVVVYEFALVK